ncbi:MAG: hypothetical protein HQ479_08820 [Rhodobacter sp.]|nr:hypothetical protein [Rhodobacter sp.]
MDIFGTVVHGLNLAAIYGLMAIGISILWSSIGMINMARLSQHQVMPHGWFPQLPNR